MLYYQLGKMFKLELQQLPLIQDRYKYQIPSFKTTGTAPKTQVLGVQNQSKE